MNGNTHGVRELFQFESICFLELESWNTLKYSWSPRETKKDKFDCLPETQVVGIYLL